MKKTDRCELSSQFESIFHEKAAWYMEIIGWELSLDIFKLEGMLKDKYGYSRVKDMSMSDFIESKFWVDAKALINKML